MPSLPSPSENWAEWMSEVGDFPASRATFKVYVGGTTLFEAQLDATEVVPTRPISETQLVGFELWGLEPSADYRVRLGGGDARSTHDSASGVLVVHARLFARFAAWEEGLYFESARGRPLCQDSCRTADVRASTV